MSRSGQDMAKQTYKNADAVYKDSSAKHAQLYGQLFPFLKGEMMNPQGFGAADLAAMDTASQQSVGGAVAGAKGEGNLTAARTRNLGSYQPALNKSVREGEEVNSQNALNTKIKNAILKEAQRQAGASGMEGMNSGEMASELGALGIQNGATNSYVNAGQSGWFQNMLALMNALKPGYSSGGGFSMGG
jgi:hypothetical protein